jgi:hypothetical protein
MKLHTISLSCKFSKKISSPRMMKTVPFNQIFTTSFFQHTGSIKIETSSRKFHFYCCALHDEMSKTRSHIHMFKKIKLTHHCFKSLPFICM